MKNLKLIFVMTLGLAGSSFAQNISFVKDSIMNVYMQNGYANKHFIPKGKTDANDLRQGKWKDYEVTDDFMYVMIDGKPKQLSGIYLMYGEGKFVDGKREGFWKIYVLEDKTFKKILQKEITYVNGKEKGWYRYFFPNGNVSQTGSFEKKQLVEVTCYYDTGKIYANLFYLNDKQTGRNTYFYPNGVKKVECMKEKDSLNGIYQSYYPSGKVEEVSFYKNGNIDEIYKYYHENGQLWVEREYKNGLLLNVRCNFDENGKARDVGTLKDGNGTVLFYTRSGEVYDIQTFKDGVMVLETKKMDFGE